MQMSEQAVDKPKMSTETMLAALEEVAARIGVKVRYENLSGGPVRTVGGSCRIRGEEVVFIERHLAPMDKLYALGKELQRFDLEDVFVPPAARKFLQKDGAD